MAEAGPSSATDSPLPVNSASLRHTHSQPDEFNAHNALQSQRSSSRSERAVSMTSIGIGHPSSSSRRLTSTSRVSSQESTGSRRRVRSVEDPAPQPGPSRLRQVHELEMDSSKGTTTTSRRTASSSKQKGRITSGTSTDFSNDRPSVAFSDEYDLSHEDPRILEDVQRALQLKARREARLRVLHKQPPTVDASYASDPDTMSSFSSQASPVRAKLPEPPPSSIPTVMAGSVESEIDFSPSIGATPLHPVPSSSDGGATLDWTASSSEDERDKRWPLTIHKRKHKDKTATYANRAVVEKQESVYSDRLAQIKAHVKPHTLRKAAITREQLQRRYTALLRPDRPSVNLLSAARWYNNQDQVVRMALDNAEPLTWLKHLLEKRGASKSSRLPWHLTAVILEEYSKTVYPPLQPIPEESAIPDGPIGATSPPVNSTPSGSKSTGKSPSNRSWSWVAPPQSLEPSLSRKRAETFDDTLSFEPQVDSGRSSAGGDSRRSSMDFMHSRKGSLVYGATDSPGSSLRNGALGQYGMSPSSSRLGFRDFATRMRRKPYNKSEEALSSGRNSISEHSQEEAPSGDRTRRGTRPPSLKSSGPGQALALEEEGGTHLDIEPALSSGDGPRTARQEFSTFHSAERTVTGFASREVSPGPRTPSLNPSKPQRAARLRPRRMSLPSLNQLLMHEQEKRQQQEDEGKERREYERKNQILEDMNEQNRKTRLLLQRVSTNIREYENVQAHLSKLLGRSFTSVPKEVLDAFSHDPASITGSTRRFETYHAVEYIHERITLQRDTLRSFAESLADFDDDIVGSVFEDRIASLSDSLQRLEQHRLRLANEAEKVVRALAEVKEIQGNVKKEYNEVMGATSLIYPELSRIVQLEESYRNKYQRFWDIGLDALTLLLDTVTPVWRNYGKIIGEDVQDFLIIPWYRNQFTGEQTRYPIKHLPRRSFRHWVGLLFFYIVSIVILLVQIGLAVSSTLHCNLPFLAHTGLRWFAVPVFAVLLLIQWTSVFIECAIVFAEFGIVIWWFGWALRILH